LNYRQEIPHIIVRVPWIIFLKVDGAIYGALLEEVEVADLIFIVIPRMGDYILWLAWIIVARPWASLE